MLGTKTRKVNKFKKVLTGLDPKMLDEIDLLAEEECRTRTELIREALRRYLKAARRDKIGGIVNLEQQNRYSNS